MYIDVLSKPKTIRSLLELSDYSLLYNSCGVEGWIYGHIVPFITLGKVSGATCKNAVKLSAGIGVGFLRLYGVRSCRRHHGRSHKSEEDPKYWVK